MTDLILLSLKLASAIIGLAREIIAFAKTLGSHNKEGR